MRLHVLVACFLGMCAPLMAQTDSPHILMISIDGLRPDAVLQATHYHLAVPNLRRFVTEGSYATGVVGVLPTLTYPSHTTLVTGVAPAEHGILSNTTFDPLFRNQVGWFWYASQQHAQTLWQVAHAAGIVTASENWPATVDAQGIDYNLPEYWRASTQDDLLLLDALAFPHGLQQHLEASCGPWVDGNTTTVAADATRTRFAIELLKEHRPGFFTLHLSALDEEEHLSAPFSKESNRALEAIDTMVGQLRQAALAADPRAIVVIVSDHGFKRTDFRTNLYGPLLRAGLITAAKGIPAFNGAPLSEWKATLWPAGGSAAVMLHDPADQVSRNTVMKILTGLAADPANGIDQILTANEVHRLGGFPDAIAYVVLRPGYQLGYSFSGPVVTPAPATGMHGYLPSDPDMRSTFLLVGQGIPAAHSLGVIDMRAIAPSLAALMQLHLRQTDSPAISLHQSSSGQ